MGSYSGLLLVCVLACTASRAAAFVNPAYNYQNFIIKAPSNNYRKTALHESKHDEQQEGTWSLEIIHRDYPGLESPRKQKHSKSSEMAERLKRDVARVEAIIRRAYRSASKTGHHSGLEDVGSPIVSGFSVGSGEYLTRLGVGTPAKQVYFVLDTGSDLSWMQCMPCSSCYQQIDPVIDPATSSSFRYVPCNAPLCGQVQTKACRKNQCVYEVLYGDRSFTVGQLATETISFTGGAFRNIAIGCGHDNEGLFVGAAGLLGLGGGSLSFPTQTNQDFSYCLTDRLSDKSSQLIIGQGAAPRGSSFTPLVRNPHFDTFYFVSMYGISVGGKQLDISRSTSADGVIVDSGTSITRLPLSRYEAVRDAFVEGMTHLALGGSFSLFDTCYNFSGLQSVKVPTVALHFEGGTTLHLPPNNYLVPVDTTGKYCLAFAPTSTEISILGNAQQQGYRISFSAHSSRVGFAPGQC